MLLLTDGLHELSQLEYQIQNDFRGRVREFRVDAGPEGLTLHGTTRTYHEKQLIQQAILRSTDTPIAANEIVVD